MKKLTFLLGSLGGALAGYVFSNKKLRDELMKTKDATQAAKMLGKHLAKDGEMVAKEVKHFAADQGLESKIAEGKKFVKKYYEVSKEEVKKLIGDEDDKPAKKGKK